MPKGSLYCYCCCYIYCRLLSLCHLVKCFWIQEPDIYTWYTVVAVVCRWWHIHIFPTHFRSNICKWHKTFQGFFKNHRQNTNTLESNNNNSNNSSCSRKNYQLNNIHAHSNLWILICKQVANTKAIPIVKIPIGIKCMCIMYYVGIYNV